MEEEQEVDVLEFALFSHEIDELIAKLQDLKETKNKVEFEIDDSNSLIIGYLNDEDLE